MERPNLIPAIVQDAETNRVLMLAWMNREALEQSVRRGEAVYWSRSRKRLWRKGEDRLIPDIMRGALALVGVALSGNIAVRTVISQGCRPIGDRFIVTKAEHNHTIFFGLDGLVDIVHPLIRFVGPYVTVCNYFNYSWTHVAEHLTEADPTGGSQRTLLNQAGQQLEGA